MNLAKDAFIILFCLAGSDGNLDKREQEIIFDFLNSQTACLGQIDFDPQQVYSELAAQSVEGQIEAFSNALQNFKTHSSEQVRSAMLDAAAEVGAADGAITDGEKRLFQTMAAVWEVDLQKFLRQRGVFFPSSFDETAATADNTKMNQACYQAWLLGSAYATYLSKVPLLGSSFCEPDFEPVKGVADVMGLTIKPLDNLNIDGKLPVSVGEMMAGIFFREESQRLAEQMDGQYRSKKVSSYFLIIAKCRLTLARMEMAHDAESVLNEILQLSIHTEIPDESIENLVSTVRAGVRDFSAFEDSVTKFLYDRQRKTMNKVSDAFAILYFLASADGSVDERELQIIVDFTNRQQNQLNFDPRQTIMELAALTGEARIEAYDRALFDFRDNSSIEDRYTLMHFAADLTIADGTISDGEKILFQDMAKVWGVDTQTLFQQSGNFVESTAAPAAPTAAVPDEKTNRIYFFAWSLGSTLALYAVAAAQMNSGLAAEYFEKARTAALGLGLYINPLTGMTRNVSSNKILMLVYLLNQEGLRLANEMDAKHGTAISAYFYVIINAYNLMINPEIYLESMTSLKNYTNIPDEYFKPLNSAVRQAVEPEILKLTISEFDRSVSLFLYNRIGGVKNATEQNVIKENYPASDSKSAAQTTPTPPITLSEPLKTLAAYGQGRVGNNEVLRALISHRGWFAPLEMFYREGETKRRVEKMVVVATEGYMKAGELWLFTDHESIMLASAAAAQIGSYGGTMSGTELFGKIPADIKSIRINPCSPREESWAFFDEGSVELARLWSEVIALEDKIKYFQPGRPDLTALGGYRGFITVVNAETNGIFLIKEFNKEMRIAAPIFTAPDSADRFLANLPPEKSAALKQITISGDTLLNDLPNMKIEMPDNQPPRSFDGAIINAYGPGAFYILPFDDSIRRT